MAPAGKSAVCSAYSFTGPVHNYEDAKKADLFKFSRFHRGMLERGIYLAPSHLGWVYPVAPQKDIDQTLAVAREVMSSI